MLLTAHNPRAVNPMLLRNFLTSFEITPLLKIININYLFIYTFNSYLDSKRKDFIQFKENFFKKMYIMIFYKFLFNVIYEKEVSLS